MPVAVIEEPHGHAVLSERLRRDDEQDSIVFGNGERILIWGCENRGTLNAVQGSGNTSFPLGTAPFQTKCVYSGWTVTLTLDGTSATGSASGMLAASGTLSIGTGAGSSWDGTMAEHIVITGTLSAGDQAMFLDRSLMVGVSGNQFAAPVSLAYNVGVNAAVHSSVLALVNSMHLPEAADAFLLWTRAAGQVVPGLVRRRTAERALFLKADG